MKFKVGDIVRVISEDRVKTYPTHREGFKVNGLLFNHMMLDYCDSICTIVGLNGGDRYHIERKRPRTYEDPKEWSFSSNMLTGVNTFDSDLAKKFQPIKTFKKELI